jgi:DNA-binding NarL/FixJ family response regulator
VLVGEGYRVETSRTFAELYRAAAEQLVGVLTPRQREIATFIARGYSNAAIARELVLVPGTVANHVEQILTRLGFRSRTQVAVLAAELGLHHGDAGEAEPWPG